MKENIKDLNHVILSFNKKSKSNLYESLPSGYITLGLKGHILGINNLGQEILGFTNNRKTPLHMSKFLCDDEKYNFSKMLALVELNGYLNDFELKLKKGKGKYIKLSASAIYDHDKNAIGFQCLFNIQDKEKLFLEHIREELNIYSTFFDNLPIGTAIKCNGEFTSANRILIDFLGYPEEYLIKVYLPDLLDSTKIKNYSERYMSRPMQIKTKSNQKNSPVKISKIKTHLFNGTDIEFFLFDLAYTTVKRYPLQSKINHLKTM